MNDARLHPEAGYAEAGSEGVVVAVRPDSGYGGRGKNYQRGGGFPGVPAQNHLKEEQAVGCCGVSLSSEVGTPAEVQKPQTSSPDPSALNQVEILDDLCVAEDPRLLQAYFDHTRGETFFLLVLPLLSKNASSSSSSWLAELQNVGTTAPATQSPKTVSFTAHPTTAPPVRPLLLRLFEMQLRWCR